MWWHSYSKITVCLLLWNISLKYGQDPNIHNLESPKPAQASKKTNKPIDAQNLHRHQKNQTTRCTKPAQAPKKQKKLKFPGTMGPLLSSCWNFCFFVWFFWCLSMFGASSGFVFLPFLVHLVVWFFWCLSMFCEVGVTKPAQAPKKQKNQTTRCTKPAQAPKNQKN